MATHRAWQFAVGAALVLAPGTENPWWMLALRAVGAGLIGLAVCKVGVRVIPSALFVLGALGLAPSAMGEQNARPALLLLAGFGVVAAAAAMTRRRAKQPPPSRLYVLPCVLLCAYWLTVHLWSQTPTASALPSAQAFALAALVLIAARNSPAIVTDALRLFAAAVGVLSLTWWVAILFRATSEPLTYVSPDTLDWRPEFLFQQALGGWVITGSPGFLDTTRSTMIAGEPGTWATWCVVGIAAAAVTFTGRLRTAMIAALCAGVLASQSYGAILLLLGVWVAYAFVSALRRGRVHPVAALAGVAGLIVVLPLAQFLIETKAATNSSSLVDRGLGDYGQAGSRINLLSTFGVDGLLTLLALAALGCMVVAARPPAVRMVAVLLTLDGLLLQPLTFHVGVFVAIGLASVVVPPASGAGEGVEHLDEQPDRADQRR